MSQSKEHERPNMIGRTTGGYFEKEFQRIFIGEAIPGLKKRLEPVALWNGPTRSPFVPFVGGKLHSCPGDYCGCFEKYDYFSGECREKPPYEHEKNFHTSPGNMYLNPYPKHMYEPYEPKVGNKMDNEQHEKTFHNSPGNMYLNSYPKHMYEPYEPKVEKEMDKDMDGPFISSLYPKAYFEDNPYKETPRMKFGTF